MLAVLVVSIATAATPMWTQEDHDGQSSGIRRARAAGECAAIQVASAEPAPPVASVASTTPTAPAEPTVEESLPQADSAAPPPQLDLDALEQHLRHTKALGFFTKLSLKNQVDDLLTSFRAFHQKEKAVSLEQLHERYNLLVLKLVALLEDGDAQLSRDILASREALWNLLADPEQFSHLQAERRI